MKKIPMLGRQFGRLVVLHDEGGGKYSCLCECGVTKSIWGNALRQGYSRSCGCLNKEVARQACLNKTWDNAQHGDNRVGKMALEYRAWQGMNTRCYNENFPKYPIYGGRGITVCDQWRTSYQRFLADMGRKPDRLHSLDRIDVNGNYEPANCRWATASAQMQNRRPFTRKR